MRTAAAGAQAGQAGAAVCSCGISASIRAKPQHGRPCWACTGPCRHACHWAVGGGCPHLALATGARHAAASAELAHAAAHRGRQAGAAAGRGGRAPEADIVAQVWPAHGGGGGLAAHAAQAGAQLLRGVEGQAAGRLHHGRSRRLCRLLRPRGSARRGHGGRAGRGACGQGGGGSGRWAVGQQPGRAAGGAARASASGRDAVQVGLARSGPGGRPKARQV